MPSRSHIVSMKFYSMAVSILIMYLLFYLTTSLLHVAMLLHLGNPTAISSSSLYVWVSSTDAWSTSLWPTWMASTSGPVHSTSGHISSAQTVHGL